METTGSPDTAEVDMSGRVRRNRLVLPLLAAGSIMLGGCTADAPRTTPPPSSRSAESPATVGTPHPTNRPRDAREVTLAFAGDVHFQLNLASLLDHPRGALGPIEEALASADLTMVNLESAITERGTPEAKELEVASERYWFRTTPEALRVLAAAGVDVVTMANNHGADYGPVGLQDTLSAIRAAPISVVGIGRDRRAAFAPYRVSIHGIDFGILGADASTREGSSDVWAAGRTNPGLAAARSTRPHALLAAVRAADRRDDVVVVYMHWGVEHMGCPSRQQRTTAQALADAGADVVVGSHAHALQGSGWLGSTYVDYGLGNFVWYQDNEPETGVLQLTFRDGQLVADSWTPARIRTYGPARPLHGPARVDAASDWRRLRRCTGLAAHRDQAPLR